MAGTIFEHSSTSLRLWYYAMYLMASTRCGISAKQIQRETGVTYKTAWRMFRQIRSLLSEPDMQLEGEAVEMDEMYYGGKRKGGSRPTDARRQSRKLQFSAWSSARAASLLRPCRTPRAKTLVGTVHEFVLPKSTIFTDELNAYNTMPRKRRYEHKRINHSSKVYVQGNVHTNTIEGFWSLVKRGIGGVYHQVSQKYLQSYLDEYSLRYNRRDQGNLIFTSMLKRVSDVAVPHASVPARKTPAPTDAF